MKKPFAILNLDKTVNELLGNKEQSTSLSGSLKHIALSDIIQLTALNQRTCLIEVESKPWIGKIWFVSGVLKRASSSTYSQQFDNSGALVETELPEQEGREAFFEILQWSNGSFQVIPLPVLELSDEECNIHEHWEFLVLESARYSDEKKSGLLPKVDEVSSLELAAFSSNMGLDTLFAAEQESSPPSASQSSFLNALDPSLQLLQENQSDVLTKEDEYTPQQESKLEKTQQVQERLLHTKTHLPTINNEFDHKEKRMNQMLKKLTEKIQNAQLLVIMDEHGSVKAQSGQGDAESQAAVNSFTLQSVADVGELLGLGELEKVGICGGEQTHLIVKSNGDYVSCSTPKQKTPLHRLLSEMESTVKEG